MLRALTVILVAIGILFVAWSLLVMTGGRDWLVANMVTAEKAPEKVAAKDEKPKATEAKPPKSAEAKPDATKADAAKPNAAMDAAAADDATPEESETEASADGGPMGAAAAPSDETEKPAAAGGDAASVDPAGNPAETAKSAEKGSLTSPYRDNYEEVAEEGHKKFMAAGCNGCHGGTGGGGMGPPLSNPVWVYGNDGDTLFRLIALGTDGLQEQGYTRKGTENVVGPMPPHGGIVKSNDDMWKIIGWIWSINPPDKSASAAQ